MKILTTLLTLVITASVAQGALYINAGGTATAGIGPAGADANYLEYDSPHEAAASGALQTFNGISFAEGGLGGTYNVGVEFTWTLSTNVASPDTVKQGFSRSQNPEISPGVPGYSSFYQDWIGMDTRISQGGTGDLGDTMTLTLTGLEANTDFILTSYHFDTHDQQGTFTTSASGSTVYANGRAAGAYVDPAPFAYDFALTSDGTGTATIDYVNTSGSWLSLNGFDLAAVPEPSSATLIGLGMVTLLLRRNRK